MRKKIIFLILLFCTCFVNAGAQTVSNVRAEFTADCQIEVEYDLSATDPVDLILQYSSDGGLTWISCTSVSGDIAGQTTGDNKLIVWNNQSDDIYEGWYDFRIKLPPTVECVMINGVCWSTHNVNVPGTFVNNPEDAGKLYQWNRAQAWSATDPMINSDGGTAWDDSNPDGITWEAANDPSPAGYRVPTLSEIEKLFDPINVKREWRTENGVSGRRFTDNTTGNSIFLPAVGGRAYLTGELDVKLYLSGHYWSSTQGDSSHAYYLHFSSGNVGKDDYYQRSNGFSIRPVAD